MKIISKIQIATIIVLVATLTLLVVLKSQEAVIERESLKLTTEQPVLLSAAMTLQEIVSQRMIFTRDLIVTKDVDEYQAKNKMLHSQLDTTLQTLAAIDSTHIDINAIKNELDTYHGNIEKLAVKLASERDDQDLSLTTIVALESPLITIDEQIQVILASIAKNMDQTQSLISNTGHNMKNSMIYLGMLILLSLVLILLNIKRLAKSTRNQARLSQFVARSPQPIMSIDQYAEIIYTNPAADNLLIKLGLTDKDKHQLLPVAIMGIIKNASKAENTTEQWSHHLKGRIFKTTLHWMNDSQKGNIYLDDITESEALQKRLNFLAYFDPLTHLPNRRRFEEEIENIINLNRYSEIQSWAVGLIRLDRFTHATIGHGYNIGDQLLASVATRLKESLLDYHDAHIFRFDGARFGILARAEQGAELVNTINQAMLQPIIISDISFYFSLSVGYTTTPGELDLDSSKLIINAGAALERASEMGGNRVCKFSDEMRTRELEWLSMENELRRSLNEEKLELFYQPQVNTNDGELVGMEALARWHYPDGSYIPPSEFIPLAERVGLIEPLGNWVMLNAFKQAAAWERQYRKGIVVAVNVSTKQFNNAQFLSSVQNALVESGVSPKLIEIEITESALMENMASAMKTVEQIVNLGMSVSIDDFGTGYSSMSYLKDLAVQKIKIDRAFIMGISNAQTERVNKDKAIVTSIVELGHNLNIKVIAEGVDDSEQIEFLRKIGCNELQGFLISPPRPANELKFLFEDNEPNLDAFDI